MALTPYTGEVLTTPPEPKLTPYQGEVIAAPPETSTIMQETGKAPARVIGGIAQEAGEAVQYLTGDRLGKGLRNWGEKTQADNAMTPGFVAEHPVLAEVGSAAEGVAKIAPYIAAQTALNASPAGRGLKLAAHAVLPVVLGASQGERSYDSGIENGLSSDEAIAASRLPAAVTGAGMAAMGPAVGGVRKLLPKAMEASTARAAGKSLMSSVLPDLAAGTAAGTAVMQAQGVATALAEKVTGARPDADPIKEIITNPKAWLSAALTGGMFEALSLPGKLAHGEGVKAALNHPEIPKATKAQIILGTAEEIKKTDPEAAAAYRATELEKLHKGEELDTAPLEALLPKEPEKAPPVEDQKEEIINAVAESLGLEDQSPLDVLQGKEAEKSAAHIEEKLAPHAAEAAEVAKSPEERAAELIQRGQLVIRRGEGLDPAVEEALAAEGKMLKDLGPELTGSIPRHRFEIVDIPLEVPDAAGAKEAAGAEPVATEAERAVPEEAAAPSAAAEVKSAPIANGEQRLAYEGNENLVVARKDDRIALIDQKEGKLLGLAAIRKDGKLGTWEDGKEPATPQERVEIERAFRQHLGEEARLNRTPSPDEIRDAKAETVKRLADQKGLEAEAQRQGVTADDLSSRLEVQLDQYNKILAGEATYAEFQAPLEAAAIKTHLDPIIKKLKTPVEIVGSAKEIPGLNVDTAFSGAYHDGKIYLNAEHLGSLKEAERVLVEHEIAHSGLRGMLGGKFDSVMAKAWADQAEAVRKFAAEKGIDITSKAGKLEAAEEYVVSLAEHGTKNSVWERFTATVKEWLRKAGFDLKFTDAELREMVLRARASEMEGGEGTRFSKVENLEPTWAELLKNPQRYSIETWERVMRQHGVDVGEIAEEAEKDQIDFEDVKDWLSYQKDLLGDMAFRREGPYLTQQLESHRAIVGAMSRQEGWGADMAEELTKGNRGRFNRVTAAAPEEAREGVSAASDVAFKTGAVLKHLGDKVFRFVFPEDRIIKAALGTFRFNPIHAELGNLSEYKQRMAGAATDILHAVHTNGADFKKLFKTEELQDKAARLAFLESVYQLDGSAPLTGQWTPETREIPDTHPNAPEDATREVQGNKWSAPDVKGFAEAQTIEEAYREIRAAMAELNPQQLKAVRGLQDHVREADTLRLTALKEKNNFLFGEGSEEALAANARIDEVSRLAGRYMPLTRFGDHLVRVYEGPDGDHVRTQSFESRSGAVDYVAQMRDQGKHAVLEVREPHDGHAANIPASFLDRVQKAAEANGLTGKDLDNFIAEYKRQWASTLPDSSLRANEVRRSNMAGFDTNLLRVYEHHMQKFANAVPKIRYGVKIEQTFRDMRNNIKTLAEDQASDTRLVQEMYELHNALYERQHVGDNERINPLVKMVNKGVFLNYLASPSVWLVQWSQPFMITLPKLASRHGAVSSTAEFNRAAKEYLWGKFSDEKIQAFDQAHGGIGEKVLGLMDDLKLETRPAESRALRDQINGIYEGLSADERSLLVQKMMILRGGNDLAFSHDVADEISGASKLDRGVNKMVEAGGIFMRKSETGSRRASNLAAFNLEYGKSRDFAKASDYAMEIIDDTLYNFDSENRAGWMRGNAGRLLGMFQYFRLHTIAKEMQLVRDAIGRQHDEAIKAANGDQTKIAAAKAAKLEARKELAWQMAATMTFAGAAGTPLAMMASNTVTDTIWSALQFLFGDPDDPITLGQMAEAKAKEMFGDTAGNALSRGVFSLADIDVSRRIGMGGIANLVPGDPPPGLSGSRRSEWYAARILGPTWGMLTDQMRAMEAYSNGDTGRAMQYASPKILKDMMKAYDINEEGVHSATGKTILPPEMVTPYAVALQMVGINPMDVTLAKEEAREISNLSTLLTKRRSGLVSAFQKAQERGDFEGREEALEAISAWGQKNPKLAISQKELAGAVRKAMEKKAGKPTKKELLAKEMLEKAGG